MLNVLICGSKGQVGSEIVELSGDYEYQFLFTDKDELDITNESSVREFAIVNNIQAIINCAAYTAVDKAQTDQETAYQINATATKILATIARDIQAKFVHISTDYVFDGTNHKPYKEDDKTNPQGYYGVSKLNGEDMMREINPKHSIIIRTSWVYSSYGANFVKTMLRYGNERDSLNVVYDQVGTPTYAKDLAKAILDILPQIQNDSVEIYHYSNEGAISWYDFAKEIMKMAKIECKINPIESYEYPTPTTRPHYSVLNKAKIKNKYNISIPYWKDSLKKCLEQLGCKK